MRVTAGSRFQLSALHGWLLYHTLEDLQTKPPLLGTFADPPIPNGTYEVLEVRDHAARLRFVPGTHDPKLAKVEHGAGQITKGQYRGAAALNEGWVDADDLRVYGKPAGRST